MMIVTCTSVGELNMRCEQVAGPRSVFVICFVAWINSPFLVARQSYFTSSNCLLYVIGAVYVSFRLLVSFFLFSALSSAFVSGPVRKSISSSGGDIGELYIIVYCLVLIDGLKHFSTLWTAISSF